MTALIFWLMIGGYSIGPYDSGLRFPDKAFCDDIVEVIYAAELDARDIGASLPVAKIVTCAPVDGKGVPR